MADSQKRKADCKAAIHFVNGVEGVQGLHFDELDDSDDRKKAEALLLPAHDVSLIVDQTSLQTPGVDLRGDVVKKGARAQVSRASRSNGELEGRKSSCARIGSAVWGVFWDPPKMVSTRTSNLPPTLAPRGRTGREGGGTGSTA